MIWTNDSDISINCPPDLSIDLILIFEEKSPKIMFRLVLYLEEISWLLYPGAPGPWPDPLLSQGRWFLMWPCPGLILWTHFKPCRVAPVIIKYCLCLSPVYAAPRVADSLSQICMEVKIMPKVKTHHMKSKAFSTNYLHILEFCLKVWARLCCLWCFWRSSLAGTGFYAKQMTENWISGKPDWAKIRRWMRADLNQTNKSRDKIIILNSLLLL